VTHGWPGHPAVPADQMIRCLEQATPADLNRRHQLTVNAMACRCSQTDSRVLESEFSHLSGIEQVSTVEDHRGLKPLAHLVEVGRSKLIPFCDDRQCVSTIQRTVCSLL